MGSAERATDGEGGTPTRDAILNAAERVFGRSGYAGSSMREISMEAEVAQGLLHYYFKGKAALYRGVFERRSQAIAGYRLAKLRGLLADGRAITLEDILTILMTPFPTIFDGFGQDSRHYLQMVAEVTVATDERSTEIMSTFYDPVGREMIAAIRRVVPSMTEEQATWAYLFTVGARLQAHAHNGRASRMMGQPAERSPHEMLVHYAAGGIRAMIGTPGHAAIPPPAMKAAAKRRAATTPATG